MPPRGDPFGAAAGAADRVQRSTARCSVGQGGHSLEIRSEESVARVVVRGAHASYPTYRRNPGHVDRPARATPIGQQSPDPFNGRLEVRRGAVAAKARISATP